MAQTSKDIPLHEFCKSFNLDYNNALVDIKKGKFPTAVYCTKDGFFIQKSYLKCDIADRSFYKNLNKRGRRIRLVSKFEKELRANYLSTPCVYIISIQTIEHGRVCKIGFSEDFNKRLLNLRIMPMEVTVHYTLHTINHEALEEVLHKEFQRKRITGEWFKLNQNDLQIIEEIINKETVEIRKYNELQCTHAIIECKDCAMRFYHEV